LPYWHYASLDARRRATSQYLKSGTYQEEKVLDAVTADMTLVEALFSGPALEDPEAATDTSRYVPKPQGTSDQGYRED
jgi:hypothetical protein